MAEEQAGVPQDLGGFRGAAPPLRRSLPALSGLARWVSGRSRLLAGPATERRRRNTR